MKDFLTHFFHWETQAKSALGAAFMAGALVYENRANPFELYALALAGQVIYSFLLGNFWMSSYLTLKQKHLEDYWWGGVLSAVIMAVVVAGFTVLVQTILMNPEALMTARWALGLSLFAFLFNEAHLYWRQRS